MKFSDNLNERVLLVSTEGAFVVSTTIDSPIGKDMLEEKNNNLQRAH